MFGSFCSNANFCAISLAPHSCLTFNIDFKYLSFLCSHSIGVVLCLSSSRFAVFNPLNVYFIFFSLPAEKVNKHFAVPKFSKSKHRVHWQTEHIHTYTQTIAIKLNKKPISSSVLAIPKYIYTKRAFASSFFFSLLPHIGKTDSGCNVFSKVWGCLRLCESCIDKIYYILIPWSFLFPLHS